MVYAECTEYRLLQHFVIVLQVPVQAFQSVFISCDTSPDKMNTRRQRHSNKLSTERHEELRSMEHREHAQTGMLGGRAERSDRFGRR